MAGWWIGWSWSATSNIRREPVGWGIMDPAGNVPLVGADGTGSWKVSGRVPGLTATVPAHPARFRKGALAAPFASLPDSRETKLVWAP